MIVKILLILGCSVIGVAAGFAADVTSEAGYRIGAFAFGVFSFVCFCIGPTYCMIDHLNSQTPLN